MAYGLPNEDSSPSTPKRKFEPSKSVFAEIYASTTPAGLPQSTEDFFPPSKNAAFPEISKNFVSPSKPRTFSQESAYSPQISTRKSRARSSLSFEYKNLSSPPPPPDSENGSDEEDVIQNMDGDMELSNSLHSEDANDKNIADSANDVNVPEYENEQCMDDYSVDADNTEAIEEERGDSDRLSTTPQSFKDDLDGLQEAGLAQHSLPTASRYEKIARDMYFRDKPQTIDESDDIILSTEAIITTVQEDTQKHIQEKHVLEDKLSTIVSKLTSLWDQYDKQTAIYRSEEYITTVGPPSHAPRFAKANFLASLALKINHPPKTSSAFTAREMSLPKRLLEWMEEHHNPYPTHYEVIQGHKPSPANHPLFWDTIFNCLIRGRVAIVTRMIKDAGWNNTRSPPDNTTEGQSHLDYSDITLSNIEKVINITIQTLLECPATHGDWNCLSNNWTLFRLRASQSLEEIKRFSEGRNQEQEGKANPQVDSGSYSQAAMKAQSLIPWHLYQSIVTLYNILMGDKSAILSNSQDWCEATIGLVAWWYDEILAKNLSHSSLKKLGRSKKQSISSAFDKKLRISFEAATSDSTDFKVNTANEVEVALASLFENDFESVISFLRGWSGPISCAVAEIASLARWLPKPEEKSLIKMGSLDQEDFDVLGIGSSPSENDGVKDRTLITYANNLSKRGQLRSNVRPQDPIEGWELAIAIFGRLDSTERSQEIIWDFLQQFTVRDSSTVQKLLALLTRIGLTRHAESAAQSYADELADQSSKYGEALYYYALAHKGAKVKETLDKLMSHSLVQSSAYPPEEDLDPHLRRLITSPKSALSDIASIDVEAARLLQKSLSGYATLRKFYELRDRDAPSSAGYTAAVIKSRKAEAAVSLITVISSSSYNIRGGLYDSECDAVVNLDLLLALLGESLVLVNQKEFSLTAPQIEVLLRAIEDLQTVPAPIYAACVDFLQNVLDFYHTGKGPMSVENLRQSTKSLKGSRNLLNIDHMALSSQTRHSAGHSGLARDGVKRGWDWREVVMPGVTGDYVLKVLRLGLAKDLARTWLAEVDNQLGS